MSKKIIVCGDSWNSITFDLKYRGTHYSELLSNKLDLELVSFAVGGSSNRFIVIQTLEAIKLKPELIIVGFCASSSRVEIPGIDFKDFNAISLKDFYYHKRGNPVNPYDTNDNSITSSNISSIEDKQIRQVYARTNSHSLNYMSDVWSFMFLLRKLSLSGIPFLLYPSIISSDMFSEDEYKNWCDEKNVVKSSVFNHLKQWNVHNMIFSGDPGYHTSTDYQKVVANFLYDYIIENKIYEINK